MTIMDKTRSFQIIINSSEGISKLGGLHWQKRGATWHIQRKTYFNLDSWTVIITL